VSERVVIGIVRRARGVHGELVIESMSDVPNRFSELEHAYLVTASGPERVTVSEVRYVGDEVWLKLNEITEREQAQELRGATLEIDVAQRPALPEGTYYYDELEGMDVVDTADRRIGRLTKVYPRGGQDLYGVETAGGEALIPADQAIVKQIDREKRRIVIDPPPGLLPDDKD
jgi:16S rRNA processing protein RimM